MQQKMIQFSGDVSLPAVWQGTWYMGEDASQRKTEVAALRAGIELGLTLIDTAEMYADGGAEKVVGEALTGLREKVFLVSKVYPWNAGGMRYDTPGYQGERPLLQPLPGVLPDEPLSVKY